MEKEKLLALFAIKQLREGGLWALLGSLIFLYSAAQHQAGKYSGIWQSPYLLVGLCGVALTALGAVLLLGCRGARLAVEQPDQPLPAPPTQRDRLTGVLLVLGLSVAYCYLLPLLGFIIATAGYLYALMLIMGERRQVVLAFGAATTSAVIYLIFAILLGVLLP